jgi:hypothetical protein
VIVENGSLVRKGEKKYPPPLVYNQDIVYITSAHWFQPSLVATPTAMEAGE